MVTCAEGTLPSENSVGRNGAKVWSVCNTRVKERDSSLCWLQSLACNTSSASSRDNIS